jgi:hypothetical protein
MGMGTIILVADIVLEFFSPDASEAVEAEVLFPLPFPPRQPPEDVM